MIRFRIDGVSGVPPYLQIARQVRRALRLGVVKPGDQLPRVKDVVGDVAVNPNTVLKAYRELEHDGLVEGRPGLGTFVVGLPPGPSLSDHAGLVRSLGKWVERARAAGLAEEDLAFIFEEAVRGGSEEGVA